MGRGSIGGGLGPLSEIPLPTLALATMTPSHDTLDADPIEIPHPSPSDASFSGFPRYPGDLGYRHLHSVVNNMKILYDMKYNLKRLMKQ